MKPKVFIALPIPPQAEAFIAEYCEYRKWDFKEPIPRETLLKEIVDMDGLLMVGGDIDQELLNCAPKLKVVSNISVGYNNFDLEAMKKRSMLGTNTPSVLDETVADLVLALVLASARRIPELDRYVKDGKWKKGSDGNLYGVDVHHATIGIIGMGRIGEAIAKRAKYGFDMNVFYYNRTRKIKAEENLGAQYCTMEELLQKSDFVVLMTPLTPETTRIMGHREFSLMKDTAFFINASRGQTVDEQALLEALVKGKIRGAGIDVYEQEPIDPEHPLLKMPNVVTLPHIGSATEKTRLDMAMLAAKNMVQALKGEQPPNIVDELRGVRT
ncbi:2-hydroxyacid dehydrogenase [Neobacillus ginsengisoli]|uniref:Gluconate 2-dehydrogenase n=1 Tax=Neobacillus ginsengisoli TaxID=904295 RepID=A0ABT9XUW9_9BACI|nr:D-glycerate dehydrogenase [Neobacillus ginsengisoli]MDQ0199369.1 gluconate 2-dehydrogenase [Neobacillus ginsengisoli]